MGEAAGDRVLSRLHSVRERIGDSLSAHPNELVAVFTRFDPISLCCTPSLPF
jgi:sucrose synthase